jgi:hypothetical protein
MVTQVKFLDIILTGSCRYNNKLWKIRKVFPIFSKKIKNNFLYDLGEGFLARFSPGQIHIQIAQKTPCLV